MCIFLVCFWGSLGTALVAQMEAHFGYLAKFNWEWVGSRKLLSYDGAVTTAHGTNYDPGNWNYGRTLEIMLGSMPARHPLQGQNYNDETRGDYLEALLGLHFHYPLLGELQNYRSGIEATVAGVETIVGQNWFPTTGSRSDLESRYELYRMHVIEQAAES